MNAKKNTARLNVEALEDRQLLAVSVVNGDLIIKSGNGNDVVTVSNYSTSAGTQYYRVKENASTKYFLKSKVWGGDVYFYGNKGNDSFNNVASLRSTAFGGIGNDTLWGGSSSDTLVGDTGNDTLLGFGSSDQLEGGDGVDILDGGDANDTMYGGAHNDMLFGQNGHDSLYGQAGSDWLWGGSGDDYLDGGTDADFGWGEQGSDTFRGLIDVVFVVPAKSPKYNYQTWFAGAQDYTLFQDRL